MKVECEPAEDLLKLAISPDAGSLRLGRRLLALASPWRTHFDYAAVGN